VKGMLEK